MSEFFNVNLLGIIGTVTGIFALVISYWAYSKQKPNLKVKVTNCVHNLPAIIGDSQHREMSFWAKFQIKNVGDRGTSINDIVLSFTINGKEYQFHEKYFEVPSGIKQSEWIEAHDTFNTVVYFKEQFDGTEQNQIACIFTIYDTHKTYHVKAISKKEVNSVLVQKKPQSS